MQRYCYSSVSWVAGLHCRVRINKYRSYCVNILKLPWAPKHPTRLRFRFGPNPNTVCKYAARATTSINHRNKKNKSFFFSSASLFVGSLQPPLYSSLPWVITQNSCQCFRIGEVYLSDSARSNMEPARVINCVCRLIIYYALRGRGGLGRLFQIAALVVLHDGVVKKEKKIINKKCIWVRRLQNEKIKLLINMSQKDRSLRSKCY